AARLPGGLRALPGAGRRGGGDLLRRLHRQAGGLPGVGGAGGHRHAVSLPVRHHCLRRLLGLSRSGLLGHHLQADRARDPLLAGLSLLGVTVWLRRSGRRSWYTLVPALFLLAITVWSLLLQALAALRAAGGVARLNGGVALALVGLAAVLAVIAARALARPG